MTAAEEYLKQRAETIEELKKFLKSPLSDEILDHLALDLLDYWDEYGHSWENTALPEKLWDLLEKWY